MASLVDCYHFLWSPRVKARLKEYLVHLKLYEERLGELNGAIQNLKKARDAVQHKVDEEDHRYGRGIPVKVKEWVQKVNLTITDYEKFNEEEEDHQLAVFDLFKSGYLPKLGIRYGRSRKAFQIISSANGLLKTANHDTFSYWLGPPSMDSFFHTVDYESFLSRDATMEKIKDALKSPNVRLIGLHGLSGVGKTTLVKEIARETLQSSEAAKMFDVVAMSNVTRNPNIRKIQGQIADMLGMKLDEESDIARAARIRRRLKNEKESTLIILDDLWAALDFSMLGIPMESSGGDGEQSRIRKMKETSSANVKEGKTPGEHSKNNINTESKKLPSASSSVKTEETLSHYKGCKVLLISESKQVLLRQTNGKENYIYFVEVLKEKEAEVLFKKMAGVGDGKSEFDKLATQIANKCNGLPMSIVTTARALKDQSRSVWEDVHRHLDRGKLIGASEFSTKLSYDLLENEDLKYTFLLCARMGPDALIMDLVKYCIGLGFLQGIYTVKEARDRVYALVGKLKVFGLLSDSYSSDHFTMSDIVCSAALSIASEEKHVFNMTKGKLDEWPDEDKLERYTAISLHHCEIIDRFPSSIKCPKLRVFHVNNNDPHLEIPESFFEGMHELRVLILTGINLSPFPSSIRCLTKLRMLCLENCKLGENLSIIGELKKLRILNFSGSDIEKLPVELKFLTKLQIFDISNCSKLTKIPSHVISSLISLEELYMRDTLIQWEVEEQTYESENASLSELRNLNQLTTLDIQIPNVAHLPKNLFFDKLYSYKIVIGDLNAYSEMDSNMPEKYEASKFLAIQLKNGFGIHSQKGIKMLFERVEHLFLEDLSGVNDIFYRLNLNGFPYLKHLVVLKNSNIRYLMDPKKRRQIEKAFPKLESLYLGNLENFHKICSCKLSAPSFGKLKVVKINLCHKLENVFLNSMVSLLTVLETIDVSECYALKEIVEVEIQRNTDKIEVLKFPKLRSLTLHSLSENFIGFYPVSSTGEHGSLFNEKVVVSKLERMVLSSIQIDEIWSYQHSLAPCFQNLIHLDVSSCWNLTYLISVSMASSLVNLQSLFVSQCEKMTDIFPQGQGSQAKTKGGIFPNLKNIKLTSMKSLREIWNSGLPSNSFGKLDTLIIEECDKFVSVFPCYMKGIFQSLCNLRVTNCKSMKAVFELDDKKQNDGGKTNLQDVYLESLPKLEYVWKWSKHWDGILNFNNLQKISVRDCDSLQNIFPVCVARCLSNLESLVIWDCYELREIVAKGEGTNTVTSNLDLWFNFPKLTSIKLSELPKLLCFYQEAYKLSCPSLNDLSIELCDRLEPFRKETTDGHSRRPALFSEEVINKLKSMHIESWHAMSSNSYMGEGNHRRDNIEELSLSRLMSPEILYSFIHNNPNLNSLSLSNCSFTDIVPLKMPHEIENLGVVPKLKILKLIDLPDLEMIGFERDIILQRIELFILKNCPCLVNIMPSSVSLTHLTNLEVVNCSALVKLMPLAAAKSLVQLDTMKVIKCESMVEIIGNEEENAGKVDIVFRQLKVLELVSLKNLNCFSNSCVFEFPSLEKVVVSACPKMETFSKDVSITPLLQKVYIVHEMEKKWCWKDDLKTTVEEIFKEKKFFEGMNEISLSEHHDLLQVWNHGDVCVQRSWFNCLKILKLEDCENLSCAIPAKILQYLKSLNELEVRNCNNLEAIFEENLMNDTEVIPFQLKVLTLESLSKLRYVWGNNCQGNLKFQNLQQVLVIECNMLQTLFPVALAKNLKKLESLKIDACMELLEVIGKEEQEATNVANKFVFPSLTWLLLYRLPKLTYIHPDIFTVEFPKLNILQVFGCPKLELFQSSCPDGEVEDSTISTSINRQPLFSDFKAISILEDLTTDWKHYAMLRSRVQQHTEDLKFLKEIVMFFDLDNNEKPTCPFDILEKAPNLHEMSIHCCNSLDIFYTENPKVCGMLKILTLDQVSQLSSIGLENSWLNTVCEKLHELNVTDCPDLTKLSYSPAVSFSSLKELYVKDCNSLEYLFTSSMTEVLVHLEEITIIECDSITEIMKMQDETTLERIKLERLYYIDLNALSSLTCFYSGNELLELPALTQVDIWKCPKMEFFSRGEITAQSLRGIQASADSNEELVFHNDLNASVKRAILLQMLSDGTVMSFSEYPELQEAWHEGLSPENNWLSSLETLKLDYCDIKPYVHPANILPCLKRLEELEVRKCNSLDMFLAQTPKISEHEILGELKILTLYKVSELRYIDLEDSWLNTVCEYLHELNVHKCPGLTVLFHSPSVQFFSYMRELYIYKCHGMEYLFTSSVAKVLIHLEKIIVKESRSIKEIMAKEQDGTTFQGINFKRLSAIFLTSLSSLGCFYSGNDTLYLPSLTQVDIWKCPKMEIFSFGEANTTSFRGIQASIDSNDELVFHIDINASVEKVFLMQDHLVSRDSPLLKSIWLKSEMVPAWCFCNLTTLVVEGCEFLSDAILPTHLLPYLINLKTLEVRKCHSVKAVFVYTKIGLQGSVHLPNLEKLCLDNCENLLEIVAKDGTAAENSDKEMFPGLTCLRLWNLHNLRCIYPGMHNLEWPLLTELYVKHCPMLKFFATELQSSQDSHTEVQDGSPTNQQASVSLEKVTPCLEVLSLGKEAAKMIEQGKFHVNLQGINSIILHCFHDEMVEFPFVFCSKAPLPSIKKLVVRHSAFKEIFPSQTSDIDCTKMLSQLKELELCNLSLLKSIGFDHSWMGPFLENLETLLVWNCGGLKNLTPSTVLFSNLTKLHVKNCHGLKYLFTFSTAKTLCALQELCIVNCKSLKEIVAKEGDEYNYESEDGDELEDGDEGEVKDGDEDGCDNEDESESETEDEDTSEDEDEDEDEEEEEDEDEEEDKSEDEVRGEGEEENADEGESGGEDESETEDDDGDKNEDEEEGEEEEEEEEDESVDVDEGDNVDRIIFKQLKLLKLSSLPKLRSFYSGSSTLKFPSLEQMLFTQCNDMKIFRLGDKVSKNLQVTIDGKCPEGDINYVIMQQFEEEKQPANLVP